MKNFLIITTALLFLTVGQISAQEIQNNNPDELFNNMGHLADKYGGLLNEISLPIASSERINMYITMNSGETLKVYVIVENGKLTAFDKGELENNTLNIYTTEQTINNILNSDAPVEELLSSIKNENIKLEGVGIFNYIKIEILNMLFKLF
ncbi:conserved hypothetical protein [Methanococcus aeolicus Nankai-3]|uniref:SCP2 domain-containing protein n=1 Tax=Methanococcus aeolicus (strain ATCC BAA-1280 / DSM 17508 / OCM 812 / Nankai-3) TaxID=419665 RepID=A6UUU7_META3|nr:hypothetical protein [Methanococcus aeolicus]ABR56269.1 conserved hypothetical protein [Methanococcus aeolicus Nankai-3]